ncbi:hypothetical protein Vqi01_60060 [Micromonospora qiuiae]|uniref:Alpha/beta hydrolase n=1 Tax=Micromonospora qiuiae TaxID=502268 RepID=A0ABQ4JJS4_9ACTN|nr:hypothetical protein [Micromonospora qiuiae]GIJ30844.1 hypothetical protein Vqi01_60060 [Micromonospora qiuiae]
MATTTFSHETTSIRHPTLINEPGSHLLLRLVEGLDETLRSAPDGLVVALHGGWLRRGWHRLSGAAEVTGLDFPMGPA